MEHSDYLKWFEERGKLRSDLDSMGLSKTWLRSKNRTPLESKALQSILSAEESKRRESDKMKQMVGLEYACKCIEEPGGTINSNH